MTERLDSLAEGFVEYAEATRLEIDPESGGYNLQQVCREICDFMHSQGFDAPRNGTESLVCGAVLSLIIRQTRALSM